MKTFINSANFFLAMLSIVITANPVFAQWTSAGTLTVSGWNRIFVVDSNTVWACGSMGNQGKIWRSVNGGLNWIELNTNGLPEHQFTCIYAKDSLTAFIGDDGSGTFAGGNAHILKTTNGGNNWIIVDTTGGDYGFINGISFSKDNPEFGFIISDAPDGPGNPFLTWKTINGGQTWVKYIIPGIFNTVGLIGGTFCHNSLFYGFLTLSGNYDTTRVYLTTNGGTNWIMRTTDPSYGTTCCGFCDFNSSGNKGIYVIPGMLPRVAQTTDHGLNWEIINIGVSGTGRSVIRWIHKANQVFITAESSSSGNYVFRSDDDGLTWQPQTTPSGMANIIDASFTVIGSNIYGYVITTTGNVFKTLQDTMVIGIQTISNEIPSEFKLYQNYPNPFNPTTNIRFSLPTPSEGGTKGIKLVIYDILGREVATLVNEALRPGTYEVEWDATNYSSGVYYYNLQTNNFTETKKMILIK